MRIHPNETWLETLTPDELRALYTTAESLGAAYVQAYTEQLTRLVLFRRMAV
jgi:hypothetical protein